MREVAPILHDAGLPSLIALYGERAELARIITASRAEDLGSGSTSNSRTHRDFSHLGISPILSRRLKVQSNANRPCPPKGPRPRPPELGKGSDPALRTTPEALFALLGQYIEARDVDAILSIHDPEAGVVEFEDGVARGAVAIRDLYLEFFASAPVLNATPLQIIEAGGVAIILGDYTLDFKDENGVVQSVTGKFGDMVRQQRNGSWLYLLDNPYAPF